MEDIQTTSQTVEPCHQKLEITIPASQVDAAYKKVVKEFRQHAAVPGFRSGKSPEALLRRRYADKITQQVTQELLEQGVRAALTDATFVPVTMPTLPNEEKIEAKEGESFAFAVEFDTAPEVPEVTYVGLALKRPKLEVDDATIDRYIDDLRGRHATYAVVEREAADGDMLKVSYAATLPESEEIPAAAQRMLTCENTWLMLREPAVFPGANEKLIGAKAGDQRTVDVVFPADYREAFLAGKSFSYSFTVHEVHAQQIPELTDDLAKTMGADTVAELREAVAGYLQREVSQLQEQAIQGAIYEKLNETPDFDLPPRLLASEMMLAIRHLLTQRRQQGMSDDEMTEKRDELRAEAETQAKRRLKMRYIMEKIAAAEGVSVTDDEVQAYVESFKRQSHLTTAQFEKQFDGDAVAAQGRETLLTSRVMRRIVEKATITDLDVAEAGAEAAAKAGADQA